MTLSIAGPTILLELGGSTVVEHVGGEQTGGALALLEFRLEPGYPVPPAHVHEREDELTYVIEGALEVTLDNETRTVGAGETIFKPRGSAHAFAVAGEAPVRFLETITPAGFEGYFRAVAAAVRETGGLDRELADPDGRLRRAQPHIIPASGSCEKGIGMSIKIGNVAPSLEIEAYVPGEREARRLDLARYRGSWVVLFVYPRDFTFICPTELQAFAQLAGEFDAEDAQLVAASTDSFWSHKAWFESHPALASVRYPVLADTTQQLSEAFGVLTEDGSALRGRFVIDPEGIVRYASVVDQSVGRSLDEVLRVLQALGTGELCPVNWRPGRPTLEVAA